MANATGAAGDEPDHLLVAVATILVVTLVTVVTAAAATVYIVLQCRVWRKEYKIEKVAQLAIEVRAFERNRRYAAMMTLQTEQTLRLEPADVLDDVGSSEEKEEAAAAAAERCLRSTEV
jgi:hypothetical protein